MRITKIQLNKIVQEELNNTMLEGLMLEQQNVEKAAELAANMKDTPEVEAIFATLDKDPEAQKALKSILAQLPDESIEEAEDLAPEGGAATAATFLMVGNTMYHVAAGKALMGAVVAAGLPIAGGLTGLALVALAMRYVRSKKKKAEWAADRAAWNALSPQEKEARRNALRDGKPLDEGKKITKSQLAQIVQEELKATLSEYSDTEYDPYWDEKAEEDARDEALRSAIDELLVEKEDTPVPLDELIPSAPEDFDPRDEKEWIEDGEKYLLGLVEAGDVERVEGSADMPNRYVLAR